MKKTIYLFVAVSLIFTACKKEEGCTDAMATNYNADAEEDDGSCIYSLVGKWTPTSVYLDSTVTVTMMGTVVDSMSGSGNATMTPEEADIWESIEFTNDGKVITDEGGGDIDTADYTYSNNVLTVIEEDTTFTVDYSVTGTNLNLTLNMILDESFNGGMVTLTANYLMTIYLSKNTSGVINNDVNQRVGKTNNWFTKKRLRNYLKNY